jgi:hypothetical protein
VLHTAAHGDAEPVTQAHDVTLLQAALLAYERHGESVQAKLVLSHKHCSCWLHDEPSGNDGQNFLAQRVLAESHQHAVLAAQPGASIRLGHGEGTQADEAVLQMQPAAWLHSDGVCRPPVAQ